MHRAQALRAALKGILQLLGRGRADSGRAIRQLWPDPFPSPRRAAIRWLLTPSRSLTQPDSLMRPSLQQRFQLTVNPHAVAGQLVLAARHGPPTGRCSGLGTKLRISSPATCRRRSRSASAKSRLRPLRGSIGMAPAPEPARSGLPTPAITGFQYCAVDSMTARARLGGPAPPQLPQLAGRRAKLAPLELKPRPRAPHRQSLPQHTLVNVNPCYQITFHTGSSLGRIPVEHARKLITHGSRAAGTPVEPGSRRTLTCPKARSGSDSPTGLNFSTAPADPGPG